MTSTRPRAILVTGGRGFIGRRLVEHLIGTQRDTVISVDLSPAERADVAGRRIDVQIDIRDANRLRDLFTQFDIASVFDLASIAAVNLSKREYAVNPQMTHSMVECILQFDVEKYVFFSTQLVFRKEGMRPESDEDYYPIDAYGESKIQSELLIRRTLPEGRWLILRPTYVWGEESKRFRDGFLYRLAKGQLILPATGKLLRYYGYVGTVCAQAVSLATHPFGELPSRTLYLSDRPISMQEFCSYFTAVLGGGRVWLAPRAALRALGGIGEIADALNVPFPVSKLQADEMTRNYPVPLEPTLAVTGKSTDYPRAVAAVVSWALSDPEFSRRVGHVPAISR